ncbi:AAA family ATPase [Dehalobacterium formicoaceticum]
MMKKEIVIGMLLALAAFLGFSGYDVVPVLILAVMGVVLYILLEKKGLLKNSFMGTAVHHPGIRFDDIGGQAPAKLEIQEALDFMKHYDKYQVMGIRPLKGILLTGPPGTGKTLLAKAAATYTDSVFIAASGSEFIEMYAGVGAQRIRSIFQSARNQAQKLKKRSAVIFIDEIEVLGGKRGSHSSHLEYDQTLNQLLVEMDGINTDPELQILLMGATNRADLIDDALLRPGRFDRIVNVDLPDVEGRLQILKIHTNNKPLCQDVDLSVIAKETFGFSGAQLESLCNEGAIYALREEEKFICQKHLKEAIDKVMMGERAEKTPTKEEKKRIAYHESGHALVSETLRQNSVAYVTITSRGKALGYMRQAPASDIYLYTKEYLEHQIKIALAGAVAEEIFLGSKSSGSLNDFKQAITLAKQIIECGFSRLGIVDHELISKDLIHEEIGFILDAQEKMTRAMIRKGEYILHRMVDILDDQEHIAGEALREMLQNPSLNVSNI